MSDRKTKSRKGILRYILLLICLLSLSGTIFFLHEYFSYKKEVYQKSKEEVKEITKKTAIELGNLTKRVEDSAESVAARLTDGTNNEKNISNALKKVLRENPHFSGARIAFHPASYDPKTKLYSAGWQRTEGEENANLIPVKHDVIDDFFSCWYLTPIHEKKNSWSDPYWDKARSTWLISYSALFYQQDAGETEKKTAGVVAIDISLEYLDEIIYKNVESSGKGFGGLTTEQGKYIYHPRNEYVTSGKTLLELAEEKKDSNRLTLHEKAKKHQGVILDHTSTTTGEESWLIAEPVQHSGWSVQNTFIKDDVLINTNILRHRLITALLCGVVSVLSVLLFLLTVMSFSPKKIWGLVAIASIVLSAAIGVVWRTALTYTEYQENGFAELKNQESANRYTRKYKELNLKIIPTGLYIESLKLIGDELTVSGHIWQKYPIQDQVPQNSFYIYPTRKISVEQVDIDNQGEYKIIISSFKADIPVTISYAKYPLEVEEIFFTILPRDSDKIFFVPDFSSGHFDAAVRLPALSENIVLAA
ncbi:MAG: hypothetical protein D3909_04405, partial [Candidatus Electrothrix sp. ATG1]|nr:hypothetical protein [Candidatus Electrothrix sp. ATG1]